MSVDAGFPWGMEDVSQDRVWRCEADRKNLTSLGNRAKMSHNKKKNLEEG